jgi:hypothetical protein
MTCLCVWTYVFTDISESIITCVVEFFNPSKLIGYSIYPRVEHSEILAAAHFVFLYVSCVCRNKQHLVLC